MVVDVGAISFHPLKQDNPGALRSNRNAKPTLRPQLRGDATIAGRSPIIETEPGDGVPFGRGYRTQVNGRSSF